MAGKSLRPLLINYYGCWVERETARAMNESSDELMQLPWKKAAIGAGLLCVAALGALAVVASVRDAETLATLALALAILAFVSQLLIFSIQTWQAGEQLKRADELNAETKSLLSEARARIAGTEELVTTHHRELLALARQRSESAAAKAGTAVPPPEIEAESKTVSTVVTTGQRSSAQTPLEQQWIWPSRGEAEEALQILEELVEEDASSVGIAFHHDVIDDFLSRLGGTEAGIAYAASDNPLLKAGLVALGQAREEEGQRVRTVVLTEHGRQVARIITAPWPPPSEYNDIADRIWRLRGRVGLEDQLGAFRPSWLEHAT